MPMNFTFNVQHNTKMGELTFFNDYGACEEYHREVDEDIVRDFVRDHRKKLVAIHHDGKTESEITIQTDDPDLIDTLSKMGRLIAISRP